MQKISEPALEMCPVCARKGKESRVERLISATSFILKGSGWYKTDYGSSGVSPSNGNRNGSSSSKGEPLSSEVSKESAAAGKNGASENNKNTTKDSSSTAESKSTDSTGSAS
jgi:predicted nucleic acid-binding Zn ribbon protein